MALKTKVKASNITNLSDARYCAGMGVDWLSFPAHLVNPVTFKEITDWITGPQFILEVNDEKVLSMAEQYPVPTLEIPYHTLNSIAPLTSKSFLITLPLSKWQALKDALLVFKGRIEYVVVDLDIPDWTELNDIATHFKILVNSSDRHSMVELLLLPIDGINVSGEDELKPGLKDFDRLSAVLEELEVVD